MGVHSCVQITVKYHMSAAVGPAAHIYSDADCGRMSRRILDIENLLSTVKPPVHYEREPYDCNSGQNCIIQDNIRIVGYKDIFQFVRV